MEERLSSGTAVGVAVEVSAPVIVAPAREPLTAATVAPPQDEPPAGFDEAAEAGFLAEARERGEVVRAPSPSAVVAEESADPKSLPPLAELVNRIPPEVRETLEELFRAKFVAVKRLPAKALAPKS